MQFHSRSFAQLSPNEQKALADAYPSIRGEVIRLAKHGAELVQLPPLEDREQRIALLREAEETGQLKYSMQAEGRLHVWVRETRTVLDPEDLGYMHALAIVVDRPNDGDGRKRSR